MFVLDTAKVIIGVAMSIAWTFILSPSFTGTAYSCSSVRSGLLSSRYVAQELQSKPQSETASAAIKQMEIAINKVLANPRIKLWEAHELLDEASSKLSVAYYKEAGKYNNLMDNFTVHYLSLFHYAKRTGDESWLIVNIKIRYRPKNSPLSRETRGDLRHTLQSLRRYSNQIKHLNSK